MLTYRFLGFSRFSRLVAGQFIRCDDVHQARQRAHEMLARRTIERVEVWEAHQQVYEVTRRSLRGDLQRSPA